MKLKYALLEVSAKTFRPLTADPQQVYDSQMLIYWSKCKILKEKKNPQLTTCLSLWLFFSEKKQQSLSHTETGF